MININGKEWQVLYVSSDHPALIRNDGSLTIGSCDDTTKTIYIYKFLNRQKFKKVLCHELVHASMFSYDVYLSEDEEELLADLVATYGEEIIDITNQLFCKLRGCRNKKREAE